MLGAAGHHLDGITEMLEIPMDGSVQWMMPVFVAQSWVMHGSSAKRLNMCGVVDRQVGSGGTACNVPVRSFHAAKLGLPCLIPW